MSIGHFPEVLNQQHLSRENLIRESGRIDRPTHLLDSSKQLVHAVGRVTDMSSLLIACYMSIYI